MRRAGAHPHCPILVRHVCRGTGPPLPPPHHPDLFDNSRGSPRLGNMHCHARRTAHHHTGKHHRHHALTHWSTSKQQVKRAGSMGCTHGHNCTEPAVKQYSKRSRAARATDLARTLVIHSCSTCRPACNGRSLRRWRGRRLRRSKTTGPMGRRCRTRFLGRGDAKPRQRTLHSRT